MAPGDELAEGKKEAVPSTEPSKKKRQVSFNFGNEHDPSSGAIGKPPISQHGPSRGVRILN